PYPIDRQCPYTLSCSAERQAQHTVGGASSTQKNPNLTRLGSSTTCVLTLALSPALCQDARQPGASCGAGAGYAPRRGLHTWSTLASVTCWGRTMCRPPEPRGSWHIVSCEDDRIARSWYSTAIGML